jgi:hypothetical protein
LRRSTSDIALGHTDARLAAGLERVSVAASVPLVPVPESVPDQDEGVGGHVAVVSIGNVAGAHDTLPVEPSSSSGRGRGTAAAVTAPSATYGPELARRRSSRIAARVDAAAGYAGPQEGGPTASPATNVRAEGSSDKGRGRGRGRAR